MNAGDARVTDQVVPQSPRSTVPVCTACPPHLAPLTLRTHIPSYVWRRQTCASPLLHVAYLGTACLPHLGPLTIKPLQLRGRLPRRRAAAAGAGPHHQAGHGVRPAHGRTKQVGGRGRVDWVRCGLGATCPRMHKSSAWVCGLRGACGSRWREGKMRHASALHTPSALHTFLATRPLAPNFAHTAAGAGHQHPPSSKRPARRRCRGVRYASATPPQLLGTPYPCPPCPPPPPVSPGTTPARGGATRPCAPGASSWTAPCTSCRR